MPCLPMKKKKIIRPVDTLPHKNVNRYGENEIHRVNQPLRLDQWKKRGVNPNDGRPLPEVPQDVPHEQSREAATPRQAPHYEREVARGEPRREQELRPLRQKPPVYRGDHVDLDSSIASSRRSTRSQPLKADFFISVPIFNETLNHSFRKKNEFVYIDSRSDEVTTYHQTLSRGSSLKDLRSSGRRPASTPREQRNQQRPRSLQRAPQRERRQRPFSGSEASVATRSSYGYESETFEGPIMMRNKHLAPGLNIESDDEDER
ncbi:hypothetical protein MAR_019489 [Mya arenaria]|uniref:Uncharacterized protein n=1 Tax=Mya arenaria TaxID=6604 RepID=A0ABY7E596_MYAAR|nr:uncharacterized protein LOC128233692 [Mya arenaria]XP_052806152.1 uncharacterized protein LOC128235382 [Mya arenaria]WAR04120.1 hypothetical protein MAR_019489 [Mya arenaria]